MGRGCLNATALDGASLSEERGLCELCRQRLRNREGRCPNCGGTLVHEPELNTLTGRPLPGTTVERCAGSVHSRCTYKRRRRERQKGTRHHA